MAFLLNGMRALMVAGILVASLMPSQALDSIDFNLGVSNPRDQAAAASAADDDDEDAFFSSGRRNTSTTVATIGALPPSVAVPRPVIDVVATCRAVLADNLSNYNSNFILGCQRAVRRSGAR